MWCAYRHYVSPDYSILAEATVIISEGDRVRYSSKSGRELRSGAEAWPYAIVAVWEDDKKVLVSSDGTMIWAHTI